ncbi:hypothetical protein ACLQ3K_21980 [Tsukamurella sp. DT100]|uniref:hypothetical protein n=1 Tax=Tsukamurella sp. DT100 TaxID=3393415 RepID=UPI003CF3BF12
MNDDELILNALARHAYVTRGRYPGDEPRKLCAHDSSPWPCDEHRLAHELSAARAELAEVLTALTGLSDPTLHVRNGWIVAEAGGCTCYGGGPYGHEPGCGWEPIVQLTDLTPERRNAREDAVVEASYRTGQLDAQEAL